jgi:hypothetical protein
LQLQLSQIFGSQASAAGQALAQLITLSTTNAGTASSQAQINALVKQLTQLAQQGTNGQSTGGTSGYPTYTYPSGGEDNPNGLPQTSGYDPNDPSTWGNY